MRSILVMFWAAEFAIPPPVAGESLARPPPSLEAGVTLSSVHSRGGTLPLTPNDKFAGLANVLDFGADPAGEAPSDAAFRSAFSTNRKVVVVPAGTYRLLETLSVPTATELRGDGGFSGASVLLFSGPATGLSIGSGLTDVSGVTVRSLRVAGMGRTAVEVRGSVLAHVSDVSVAGRWTDGFAFIRTWGSQFENLSTAGADIEHACFMVGGSYNANAASNWYTGSNYSKYNFLFDMGIGTTGAEPSHGNTFSMLTAQGGTTGLFIRSLRDSVFSGIYTENVVHPIVLGDRLGGTSARAIAINGASLGGPASSQAEFADRAAVIEVDYASGVAMTGINFSGAYGAAAVASVVLT